MSKFFIRFFALIITTLFLVSYKASAEEIRFENNPYILKYSILSPLSKGYMNEYYSKHENAGYWTKMIGIYHFPDESAPLKLAKSIDTQIESSENSTLIKLVENKKQNKAVITFLVNKSENNNNFFEYNVYKYEKHPDKGSILIKYAAKYFFNTNDEIAQIGTKIRDENDKYIEYLITSPTPAIIEKDLVAENK